MESPDLPTPFWRVDPTRISTPREVCDPPRFGFSNTFTLPLWSLDGQVHHLADQLVVTEPGGRGGGGELTRRLQVAVRVHLDHVDLPRLGQAEVDPAVVADPQGPVCLDGHLLELGPELLGQVGHDRPVPLCSTLFLAHLALDRAPGGPLRGGRRIHLGRREGDRVAVAEDADVELAALDVLLGDGESLNFSWIATTRFISVVASRTRESSRSRSRRRPGAA